MDNIDQQYQDYLRRYYANLYYSSGFSYEGEPPMNKQEFINCCKRIAHYEEQLKIFNNQITK